METVATQRSKDPGSDGCALTCFAWESRGVRSGSVAAWSLQYIKKARKIHVSSPAKATRFPDPTGSPTMSNICKGYVAQNTDKATTWALRVFNARRQERNRVAILKSAQMIYTGEA